MTAKFFGTDGVRGEVGVAPITAGMLTKLGWAIAKVLATAGDTIVIAKDTRQSGYLLENAISAGIMAAGVNVSLTGPLPTPAVAIVSKLKKFRAAIMLSASHNPYQDNGVKVFAADGGKITLEQEQQIEELLQHGTLTTNKHCGTLSRIDEAFAIYFDYCLKQLPQSFSFAGKKIIIDGANGACYKIAPAVFAKTGAEVVALSCSPNGININDNCGSLHTSNLQQQVVLQQADVGIAFDGDGDRVIMVAANGDVIDGDDILYIIANYKKSINALQGGIVGTLMTNMGLEIAFKEQGLDFIRAKVGDKYVLQQLRQHNWVLGGENSGHIVALQHAPTGDGIIAALLVLAAMWQAQADLLQLKQGYKKLPQTLINLPLNNVVNWQKNEALNATVAACEAKLGESGRILLRPSGTEPVLRVMVEGENQQLVSEIAAALTDAFNNS